MINEKTYEKIRKYLAAVSKGRHKAMGSAPEHAVFVDKEQALVVGHFSCFRVRSAAAEEGLCFTELPDFKGSPPRMRGKHAVQPADADSRRITPADAGKTVPVFGHRTDFG